MCNCTAREPFTEELREPHCAQSKELHRSSDLLNTDDFSILYFLHHICVGPDYPIRDPDKYYVYKDFSPNRCNDPCRVCKYNKDLKMMLIDEPDNLLPFLELKLSVQREASDRLLALSNKRHAIRAYCLSNGNNG